MLNKIYKYKINKFNNNNKYKVSKVYKVTKVKKNLIKKQAIKK